MHCPYNEISIPGLTLFMQYSELSYPPTPCLMRLCHVYFLCFIAMCLVFYWCSLLSFCFTPTEVYVCSRLFFQTSEQSNPSLQTGLLTIIKTHNDWSPGWLREFHTSGKYKIRWQKCFQRTLMVKIVQTCYLQFTTCEVIEIQSVYHIPFLLFLFLAVLQP